MEEYTDFSVRNPQRGVTLDTNDDYKTYYVSMRFIMMRTSKDKDTYIRLM